MSDKKRNKGLFNLIAPVYGLFFDFQKNHYKEIIEHHHQALHLLKYKDVLDVGCGTGALCSALSSFKLSVTGVDPAIKMLDIAKRKTKSDSITLIEADALSGLPFNDNSFDVVFSSYVVHGLKVEQRQKMYAEMSRVAKEFVVIHDYNKSRALLTTIIEWLEREITLILLKNNRKKCKTVL